MKPTEISKAIDSSFEAVKGYIDRGFEAVERRLEALESWRRKTEIEAEVQRRIAKGVSND